MREIAKYKACQEWKNDIHKTNYYESQHDTVKSAPTIEHHVAYGRGEPST